MNGARRTCARGRRIEQPRRGAARPPPVVSELPKSEGRGACESHVFTRRRRGHALAGDRGGLLALRLCGSTGAHVRREPQATGASCVAMNAATRTRSLSHARATTRPLPATTLRNPVSAFFSLSLLFYLAAESFQFGAASEPPEPPAPCHVTAPGGTRLAPSRPRRRRARGDDWTRTGGPEGIGALAVWLASPRASSGNNLFYPAPAR